MLYGQLITQRDLGGVAMSVAQVNAISAAALNACDLVGGKHLGFSDRPFSGATYDPQQDPRCFALAAGAVKYGPDYLHFKCASTEPQ